MYRSKFLNRAVAATMGAILIAAASSAPAAPAKRGPKAQVADFPSGTQRPTNEVMLSVGHGQIVNLPANVTSVFTSNPGAADVFVNSPRQIYVFGKDFGEATVFATTASGQVVYASNFRVSQNITSIDRVLKAAMPDAAINVQIVGQIAIMTGTVASPDDSAQAEILIRTLLNPGIDATAQGAQLKIGIVNRVKTSTPLQVNLRVHIAEVNRDLIKEIGNNITTRDTTGGFSFGISQGRNFGSIGTQDLSGLPQLDASSLYGLPAGSIRLPFDPVSGQFITRGGTVGNFANLGLGAGKTTLGFLGRLFGVDAASALDLAETEGLVTTLAQPNLTALSGETASFLAGGEVPIPLAATLGAVEITYKPYGVSLSFTPTVLADGRISMRVRPEVSELSSEGAVKINGFDVPGILTRRAETTIEVGSGQSFMIAGLMRSLTNNATLKAPGVGDVPVLGALFRSNRFRRAESELMIVVTPYLVKPVNPDQIVMPTDGYKAPTDLGRILLNKPYSGTNEARPVPTMAKPVTIKDGAVRPSVSSPASGGKPARTSAASAPAPGFSK